MSLAASTGSSVDWFMIEATSAGASVHGPVGAAEVAPLVRSLIGPRGDRRVLAWGPEALGIPDLSPRLEADGLVLVRPDVPAEPAARERALGELGEVAFGLTATVGALADTGTVVVASGPGRSRLAWLLPETHIALVDAQAVHTGMAAFFAAAPSPAAHLAFITGPSRTADIELTLTRGVHGPRDLHVIVFHR